MKRNYFCGGKEKYNITGTCACVCVCVCVCVRACVLSLFSCVQLFEIWTTAHQAPVYTAIVKMDNQQRPTVQFMELCSMLYANLESREFGWEWMHVLWMAEFLHCSPETTTTLLISYIPVQNVSGVKKKKSHALTFCSTATSMFNMSMWSGCVRHWSKSGLSSEPVWWPTMT